MKVLIYKRTHTGDPEPTGTSGINDCMGQIRKYEFDAVTDAGGIGQEPTGYGSDREINWVGIKARKKLAPGYPAVVNFEHFVLVEDKAICFHHQHQAWLKGYINRGHVSYWTAIQK